MNNQTSIWVCSTNDRSLSWVGVSWVGALGKVGETTEIDSCFVIGKISDIADGPYRDSNNGGQLSFLGEEGIGSPSSIGDMCSISDIGY